MVVMWRPKRLFVVGLEGTGVKGFVRALEHYGYTRCSQRLTRIEEIFRYEAAAGNVVASKYKLLSEFYPDALFVLTVCDKKTWIERVLASPKVHSFIKLRDGTPSVSLRRAEAYHAIFSTIYPDPLVFTAGFDSHVKNVKEHFKRLDPSRTMVFYTEPRKSDHWTKIAEFIKRRMPPAIPEPPPWEKDDG